MIKKIILLMLVVFSVSGMMYSSGTIAQQQEVPGLFSTESGDGKQKVNAAGKKIIDMIIYVGLIAGVIGLGISGIALTPFIGKKDAGAKGIIGSLIVIGIFLLFWVIIAMFRGAFGT
jgi:hypothetical protein